MTLADDLKPVVYEARAIMGQLGFRQDRVFLLFDWYADGEWAGPTQAELTEAKGQPPKVHQVTFQDVPFGAHMPDIIDIGPITPDFPGGGTDLTDWLAPVQEGQTRHILRVGPSCRDGKKYRVLHILTEKSLRYMIRAQDAEQYLQGLGGATVI